MKGRTELSKTQRKIGLIYAVLVVVVAAVVVVVVVLNETVTARGAPYSLSHCYT